MNTEKFDKQLEQKDAAIARLEEQLRNAKNSRKQIAQKKIEAVNEAKITLYDKAVEWMKKKNYFNEFERDVIKPFEASNNDSSSNKTASAGSTKTQTTRQTSSASNNASSTQPKFTSTQMDDDKPPVDTRSLGGVAFR